MPIDFKIEEAKQSERFLIDEGWHNAVVKDLQDGGYNRLKPGVRQIMFIFTVETDEGDQEVRDWANNVWWFKDPAPSKLYTIAKAAGMVGKDNTIPDINDIVGKKVTIEIVHKNDQQGIKRSKIRSYSQPMTKK